MRSGADRVLVATDDERIAARSAIRAVARGRIAVMTDPALPSGTDRVAAVARARGWTDEDDRRQRPGRRAFRAGPELIDQVAQLLAARPGASIATLVTPIECVQEFLDPNIVKVVVAATAAALYFSRAPIPWSRDGVERGTATGQ